MNDIPTPITDAELCIYYPNDLHVWPEGRKAEFLGEHIVPARVCRDLERQLAEAREQRDMLADALREAQLQLEYLNEKHPSGTTLTIIVRNELALNSVKG